MDKIEVARIAEAIRNAATERSVNVLDAYFPDRDLDAAYVLQQRAAALLRIAEAEIARLTAKS